MEGRVSRISIFNTVLLNGTKILCKNNNEKKIEKALEKGYIKEYSLYKKYKSMSDVEVRVAVDLDKIRTLNEIHNALVKMPILKCTA